MSFYKDIPKKISNNCNEPKNEITVPYSNNIPFTANNQDFLYWAQLNDDCFQKDVKKEESDKFIHPKKTSVQNTQEFLSKIPMKKTKDNHVVINQSITNQNNLQSSNISSIPVQIHGRDNFNISDNPYGSNLVPNVIDISKK